MFAMRGFLNSVRGRLLLLALLTILPVLALQIFGAWSLWELGFMGLVLMIALALAWQGSERLFLRPLADLMAAVQRVQSGDLSARASAVRGLGEVQDLSLIHISEPTRPY